MHSHFEIWRLRAGVNWACCVSVDVEVSVNRALFRIEITINVLSAESQKGANAVQWGSIENQKDAVAADFVQ